MKAKEMVYSHFDAELEYDEKSPSCLIWKNTKSKKPAGYLTEIGYFSVGLKGKLYYAHRIVWLLHNKDINPDLVIDHIDGNKSNNLIYNLRLTDESVNIRNNPNRSSFMKNIYWSESEQRFEFGIMLYGSRIRKTFNVKKFETKEQTLQRCLDFRQQFIDSGELIMMEGDK